MAQRPPVSWDDAVRRLTDIDRRQQRTIIDRAARNATTYARIHAAAEPLERRRTAGIAARDALAAYLLAGGTPDHFARVCGLLDIIQDGPRAAACLADRAAAARRVTDTHSTPDRDQDAADAALRYAAALEQPHRPTTLPAADGVDGFRSTSASVVIPNGYIGTLPDRDPNVRAVVDRFIDSLPNPEHDA